MNLSILRRFWFAAPVFCDLSGGVHAFAFNINGARGQVGARRRGLDREVEHRTGVDLPQRAQGQATVAMSAGTGSAWSWNKAAATALAAMQVCTCAPSCLHPSCGLLLPS